MMKVKRVKCRRCGYEWNYKGTKKVMITCPDCLTKLKIKEAMIDRVESKSVTMEEDSQKDFSPLSDLPTKQ